MKIFSYNTIISLIISNLLLKVQLKIILNKDSQISITIKGRGNQKILLDQTFVGNMGYQEEFLITLVKYMLMKFFKIIQVKWYII